MMKFLLTTLFGLTLWTSPVDPKNPALIHDIRTQSALLAVDYSPDGSKVAAGGQSRNIIIYDARTAQPLLTLQGHTDDVVALKFSPNGRYIASGGVDNALILWDAITGEVLRKITDHSDYVRDVAFSPDSKLLASASWDGRSMVWETFSGVRVATLEGHKDNVTSVMFSPKGDELLTASGDRTLRVWDAKTWTFKFALTGHSDEVWDARYSPNGRYVASGAWDNTARVWDLESRQPVYVIPAHLSDTWATVFSPDGQLIASCGGDRKVKVWDMSLGILVKDVSGEAHTAEVENVAFNPDGKSLASVSRDGSLKIWRAPTTEDRVAAYAINNMEKWVRKGEFEKTDDYTKRMEKQLKQREFYDREGRDKITGSFGNSVDWQSFVLGKYDPDQEQFVVTSKLFAMPYVLKASTRDAERVKINFERVRYGLPMFEIENNAVLLKRVDVVVPMGEYNKTFTITR
jgi:WD40 repeat protein